MVEPGEVTADGMGRQCFTAMYYAKVRKIYG
jgi:hypothetical protein